MGPTMYNFTMLTNAIVVQATDDYRHALCEYHKAREDDDAYNMKKWGNELDTIRQFFMSQTFEMYTALDGAVLLKKLEREVKNFDYDHIALRKDILRRRGIPSPSQDHNHF